MEIAARRREWAVVGLDALFEDLDKAEADRERLALDNLHFVNADFLKYEPTSPFDVVLSIASAHYLVEAGHGTQLFSRFRNWLKIGGLLVLFGPRHRVEVPLAPGLPAPRLHDVFTRQALEELCSANGLAIQSLEPCIGRLGTLAKQVAYRAKGSLLTRAAAYPAEIGLSWLDPVLSVGLSDRSYAWRLVAKKA